jgi:hypothetical protein
MNPHGSGRFGLPCKLPITAQDWFDHLCRTLDRGFTESERAITFAGNRSEPSVLDEPVTTTRSHNPGRETWLCGVVMKQRAR